MSTIKEQAERTRDEMLLRKRMEWFVNKHQPQDRREAAEWHADLLGLVQAIHADASRTTHKLLENALAAMPVMPMRIMSDEEAKDRAFYEGVQWPDSIRRKE